MYRYLLLSVLCVSLIAGCDDPMRVVSGRCGPSTVKRSRSSRAIVAPDEPDVTPDAIDTIKITMPDDLKGDVDDPIRVDATTVGAMVEFFAIDKGIKVFPRKMLITPKSTVVWARNAGKYRIAAYTAKGDVPSDPVIFTVTITDTSSPVVVVPKPVDPAPVIIVPKPPDPVVPPPVIPKPPDPVIVTPLPAGVYGLAEFTRLTVLDKVPAGKRAVARTIAANYEQVSAQIAAGAIKTLAEANAKLKTSNRAAVPPGDISYWTAVFASLNEKGNSLKISAITDWQEAFTEFGQGFEAAGAQ